MKQITEKQRVAESASTLETQHYQAVRDGYVPPCTLLQYAWDMVMERANTLVELATDPTIKNRENRLINASADLKHQLAIYALIAGRKMWQPKGQPFNQPVPIEESNANPNS